MRFCSVVACLTIAGFCAGCGSGVATNSPVKISSQGKQLGHAQGGQQPIAGATIQLWQVNTTIDGGLGTAMLTGTVTTSDGSGNVLDSNANAGNLFNTLPTGYFLITGMYTCPVGDALVYITASGGNPGLSAGTNNPQSKMVTALGSCDNLKANVQSVNISEQMTVGTVAALYPFMSGYNAIGASPAHTADIAASFAKVNEYIDFQTGTAPGSALPASYSASTGDLNLLANVLAACVNSAGGTYNDGSACGKLFYYSSPSSTNPSTDVTAATIYIRQHPLNEVGYIAYLPAPQAPFEPADTTPPPDWTLPIFELPPTPTFSPAAGTYDGVQQVRILDADPSAVIYYAFGAAPPSTEGLSYSGVIEVVGSETINAFAVGGNGRAVSPIASATYTITGLPTNAQTVSLFPFPLAVNSGSATATTIDASSNANGSSVTFGALGALGGSFSPPTCTISGGYCSVTYTPTGSAAAGTYTNGVTASFSAAGGYTSAVANGTVYVIPQVTVTPLAAANGFDIEVSLIQASDGNFYGAMQGATTPGLNEIFKMDSAGTVTPVYTFTEATEGEFVQDHLVQGTDGAFYGVALRGGTSGNGTIFKVDASGDFTLLYSFTGTLDGAAPYRALVQGTDGSFYGTTDQGGVNGYGTVFKLDALGNFTLLHAFAAGTDGAFSLGGLVQGVDGNFYGTTQGGGVYNAGTVFKMDTSGNVTTLYSFTGGADGTGPYAGLVQATDGKFYGSALDGGTSGGGTLFRIDSSGDFTALQSFTNYGDTPEGALVQGSDGALYGTTFTGGEEDAGSLYKIDTAGNFTFLYQFSGSGDGYEPLGSLVQGSDGSFYGATTDDLFKLTPSPALTGPITLTVPATVTHGSSFTLTSTVVNASSATMQQCFATNNAGDATGWTGVKTASTTAKNATLTAPSTTGTYTYTLTCGGIESGFATLNVN